MKEVIVIIGESNVENMKASDLYRNGYLRVLYPETYLHPLRIREKIMGIIKQNDKVALVTHSPYVLGVINNLLYASRISKINPNEVDKIIPKCYWIDKCEAFEVMKNNDTSRIVKTESIYLNEIDLIHNERIDDVSMIINNEYDQLSEFDV